MEWVGDCGRTGRRGAIEWVSVAVGLGVELRGGAGLTLGGLAIEVWIEFGRAGVGRPAPESTHGACRATDDRRLSAESARLPAAQRQAAR